jgi:uncharacterized membrane protein YfcA
MTAILLGFMIATIIGLTGVGGGTITAPLLILILRMKGAVAVGTALTFAAIIKFTVAPMYLIRRQVDFKILGLMCLGGIPGVILGGRALVTVAKRVDSHMLYMILGITVVLAAAANIYRLIRQKTQSGTGNRPNLIPFLTFPIGAEVGFSSAGSGALGTLTLLGLTDLKAASVVGTDICFGLAVSIIGSGIQLFAGNYDAKVIELLVIGGVFGSLFGGFLAMRIPSRPLKWGLAVWLTGLGINLLMRGLA